MRPLWRAVSDGEGVPFIEAEFRSFLRCGFLGDGFARFRCAQRVKGYADMPMLVAALRARDRQLGLDVSQEERQIA